MEMRPWWGLLVRLFVVPASCSVLSALPAGAAELVKESRQVSGIHAVVLKTAGDLQITQGKRESLVVEAEAAVLPKLGTEVRDGVLYIQGKASPIITQQPIRFILTVRQLRGLQAYATGALMLEGIRGEALQIDAAGSSNISASRLQLGELQVTLSGSGNVTLEGRATRQDVKLSGAGQYNAAKLMSEQATINLSGAGNATVNAVQSLDVAISGTGDVHYSGNPALSEKIVGTGSVKRAAD